MPHKNENMDYIPDYEKLFADSADEKGAQKGVLIRLLSAYKLKILVSSIWYIIKAAATWVIPIVTANIINAVTQESNNTLKTVIINIVILFVIILQNIPTHIIYSKYTDTILRTVSAGMRNTLIKKLQHLSVTYHKEIESGRLQSKFMHDIEAIEFLNTHMIKSVIPSIIGIIISVSISASKSVFVTAFYIVVVPLNVFLVHIFRKQMSETNHKFRRESENISASVSTMIEMIPVTKAHGLENTEIAKLEQNIRALREKGLLVDRTNAYFGSVAWVLSQILSALCLLFCAIMAINGNIPAGDIVIYQTFFSSISGNVQNLVSIYPQLTKGLESIRSISEIVLSDNIEDNRGKIKLKTLDGNIQFNNVDYHYPDGTDDVVKNFSLSVKRGECIAFVGTSGSGKSTIVNLIIGFLRATSGEILIDGTPIDKINLTSYRHFISVVPQNTILFTGTIKDNITYGIESIDEELLERIIKLANIDEFASALPDGLNTVIGEHGDKLSGGQKQRISIARALIRNPKILILDEATSALDNISEYHVQEAISTLIKDRTTFVVAHRLSTIRNADKIIVMDKGKCVEIGTYDELMNKKGKFYELKMLNDSMKSNTETLDKSYVL